MLNYGVSALELTKFDEANQIFNVLIQRFPASPQAEEAGFLIGQIMVDQQQCQQAEQLFAPVLNGSDKAKAAQAQLSIAECYGSGVDLEKAVASI